MSRTKIKKDEPHGRLDGCGVPGENPGSTAEKSGKTLRNPLSNPCRKTVRTAFRTCAVGDDRRSGERWAGFDRITDASCAAGGCPVETVPARRTAAGVAGVGNAGDG